MQHTKTPNMRYATGKDALCFTCMAASPLHIIFCGTSAFAIPALRALAEAKDSVIDLVVTQPDRAVGRTQAITPPPVAIAAKEYSLPTAQPANINRMDLVNNAPDFLVVVSYGQRIGNALLALPRIAPINIHPSLLPRWRGASPIQHAILAGDRQTGVTIQRMVAALDAGPILARQATAIGTEETVEELHDRLADMSAQMLVSTLQKPLREQEQNAAEVTVCGKLGRGDGDVDPATMTAEHIHRRIRALVPWPGVRCSIGGQNVKLHAATLQPTEKSLPLQCAESTVLFVTRLQSPGGNAMPADAWLRGRQRT